MTIRKLWDEIKLQVLGVYSPSRALVDGDYADRVVKRLGYAPVEVAGGRDCRNWADGVASGIKQSGLERVVIAREQAYREYAAALEKSVGKLTVEERGLALANAVMEHGAEEL